MKRKLRVIVLLHPTLMPPDSLEGVDEKDAFLYKTEWDVISTLRRLGHDVLPIGVQWELSPIREAIEKFKPHVAFNLLEEFHGIPEFDQAVVSYLQLKQVPHTGCGPRGLVLARDKSLAKKILVYHRIRVPAFLVVHRGRKVRRPKALTFPLIVKSLTEDASLGISQASIVDSDTKLVERVRFIHESIKTDAIVESYIEGRELFVGALGNDRVKTLPIWELLFENLPPGAAAIATAKVKHDPEYQLRRGIFQERASLDEETARKITATTKRIFRILELDGYARLDYRLTPEGQLYFLEANPNPEIAEREEFASAAAADGIPYPELIQKILNLALLRG